MKETDIRNVIQRFGYIHNFNVPHDFRRSENKGFCFVQYVDASITQLAMNDLNGMTIPHPVIGSNGGSGCSTLRAELSHTNNSSGGGGGILLLLLLILVLVEVEVIICTHHRIIVVV